MCIVNSFAYIISLIIHYTHRCRSSSTLFISSSRSFIVSHINSLPTAQHSTAQYNTPSVNSYVTMNALLLHAFMDIFNVCNLEKDISMYITYQFTNLLIYLPSCSRYSFSSLWKSSRAFLRSTVISSTLMRLGS